MPYRAPDEWMMTCYVNTLFLRNYDIVQKATKLLLLMKSNLPFDLFKRHIERPKTFFLQKRFLSKPNFLVALNISFPFPFAFCIVKSFVIGFGRLSKRNNKRRAFKVSVLPGNITPFFAKFKGFYWFRIAFEKSGPRVNKTLEKLSRTLTWFEIRALSSRAT